MGAEGAEEEGERIWSRLWWAQSPKEGSVSQPWDDDPSCNQESDKKLTEAPRHALLHLFVNYYWEVILCNIRNGTLTSLNLRTHEVLSVVFNLPESKTNFYFLFIEETFPPLTLSIHFEWKFPDFCRSSFSSHSQHLSHNGPIAVPSWIVSPEMCTHYMSHKKPWSPILLKKNFGNKQNNT